MRSVITGTVYYIPKCHLIYEGMGRVNVAPMLTKEYKDLGFYDLYNGQNRAYYAFFVPDGLKDLWLNSVNGYDPWMEQCLQHRHRLGDPPSVLFHALNRP